MCQLFCVMGFVRKDDQGVLGAGPVVRTAMMGLSCLKALKISNAYGVFHTETRAPVRQVAVSAAGRTVVACCEDGTLWRWDASE